MADFHVQSMFGGVPIWLASIETDDGRDIAVQSPARGSCEILFVSQPGQAPYLDRFDAFRALVARGEPQIFSHPLIGSYRARAEGGTFSANSEESKIRYHCAFLPEDEPQPTAPTGAGVAPTAGVDTVKVAAAAANDQLAATGLSSTTPNDAIAFITALAASADADSQAAIVGVATLTGQINTAIETLDLATHIDRWPLYQSMINLLASVQLAGQAMTSDVQQLISLRADRARPLFAICAEVYGPELAIEQADRVTRLNRVRTPNRVPAGTTLKMPAPVSA